MTIQEQGVAKLTTLKNAFDRMCAQLGMDKTIPETSIQAAFSRLDATIDAFNEAADAATAPAPVAESVGG